MRDVGFWIPFARLASMSLTQQKNAPEIIFSKLPILVMNLPMDATTTIITYLIAVSLERIPSQFSLILSERTLVVLRLVSQVIIGAPAIPPFAMGEMLK